MYTGIVNRHAMGKWHKNTKVRNTRDRKDKGIYREKRFVRIW